MKDMLMSGIAIALIVLCGLSFANGGGSAAQAGACLAAFALLLQAKELIFDETIHEGGLS
jgi:hypothetical protein